MRLQDNVIGEILDRLEISDEGRDYQFDGGVTSTIDVYPLLDRQASETLKAVGKWLKGKKYPDIETNKMKHIYPALEADLESLLKGEMPE